MNFHRCVCWNIEILAEFVGKSKMKRKGYLEMIHITCDHCRIFCDLMSWWRGGGLQGYMTQKDANVGKFFGRVFRPQTLRRRHGGHTHFQNLKLITIKFISHQQSIDSIFLSSHTKFRRDWPKNVWVMSDKRMPIYGIIDIFRDFLTHNLAKY